MSDRRLRQLADDYAHRRMGTEPYRMARAELLDALVSGETHLEDAGPRRGRGRTAPWGLTWTRRQLLSAALVVVGGIISVVLVWALSLTEPASPPPPAQDATECGPRPAELLETFVSSADWSPESLSTFHAQWRSYDAEAQRKARRLAAFQRLTDALNRELDQEYALLELGEAEGASLRATSLTAFAHLLDIPVGFPDTLPYAPDTLVSPSPTTTGQ